MCEMIRISTTYVRLPHHPTHQGIVPSLIDHTNQGPFRHIGAQECLCHE